MEVLLLWCYRCRSAFRFLSILTTMSGRVI